MSDLKEGWKEAGKDFAGAFKRFGKTTLKSARTVVDKVDDKCNKPEKKEESDVVDVETTPVETEVVDSPKEKESNVFNDGSWREVGKGLGKGFGGIGKMIGKTIAKPFTKNTKTKKPKKNKIREIEVKDVK